jgi:hypothetical protein
MRRLIYLMVVIMALCTGLAAGTVSAAVEGLRAAPPEVQFGTLQVATFTLRSGTVTNRTGAAVQVLATAVLMPDDFSFGLLPGSTCPVLEPAVLADGESCDVVVGFRPSEFFAGSRQTAAVALTARDPLTGEVVDTIVVEFQGTGR